MTEYLFYSTPGTNRGGMGDTFVHNFRVGGDLGYCKALKARGDTTRLCLRSHRPYMDDLFSLNPYIDTMDRNEGRLGRQLSAQEKEALTWERPEFYLDDAELTILRAFCTNYIVIHPGSTQPAKIMRLDLRQLIASLCDSGRPVVLLGGSYQGSYYPRVNLSGTGRVRDAALVEEFSGVEHPLFLNAVNRLSVRAQAYLATHAIKFIGSQSAFACAAEIYGVPTLTAGPRGDGPSEDMGFPFRSAPFFNCDMSQRGMVTAINSFLEDEVMKLPEPRRRV